MNHNSPDAIVGNFNKFISSFFLQSLQQNSNSSDKSKQNIYKLNSKQVYAWEISNILLQNNKVLGVFQDFKWFSSLDSNFSALNNLMDFLRENK